MLILYTVHGDCSKQDTVVWLIVSLFILEFVLYLQQFQQTV